MTSGSGATGRNGGHLTANTFQEFTHAEAAYGRSEAVKGLALEEWTVQEMLKLIASKGISKQVDLVAGGHNELFTTPAAAAARKADHEAVLEAGVSNDIRWMNSTKMNETYGTTFPGVRTPGNNFWPVKVVSHLFDIAKSSSENFELALHTHTPVTSIVQKESKSEKESAGKPSHRWIVHTPRGSIKCSYIIHGTNAYASYLLPQMAGIDGIVPTRGQMAVIRPNASSKKLTEVAWGANDG